MKMIKQKGFLTLVAILFIVIIGFMGVAITYMFTGSSFSTANSTQSTQAFYLAGSALEHAAHRLLAPTLSYRTSCSGLSISNTLGSGNYTATSTGPYYVNTPTTLNGALTASATTIPVVSTAGYQPYGRIMIDNEIISYTALDATDFLNAVRGVDIIAAASHISGASVGQYQCSLQTQGGIPNVNAPTHPGDPGGKRILTDVIQLQEGWAVAYATGGNQVITRFNRPTETIWQNYSPSIAGTSRIRGVSLLSYVDGWMVGGATGAPLFYHWDGNAWNNFPAPSGIPSVLYNGVDCFRNNKCAAVGFGSGTGSNPSIVFWNGTTWASAATFTGTIAQDDLYAISCPTLSNCWAVGDHNKLGTFYNGSASSWTGVNVSSLTGFQYKGVFCNTNNDCWAAGFGNTLARYDGTTWSSFTTTLANGVQYFGIYCNSSTSCWVVGDGGNIGYWDGNTWSPFSSPTTKNLRSVSCLSQNDCWIVGGTNGTNNAFLHFDGNAWTNITVSGSIPLQEFDSIAIVGAVTQPRDSWQESF